MDIYALGQILYYCVTGRTIKGSGYHLMSETAPALSNYDLLIDKMVRQEPSERFQSVAEIELFLANREKISQRPQSKPVEPAEMQRIAFHLSLHQADPLRGKGFHFIDNEEDIQKIMSSLARFHRKSGLGWILGYKNGPASPFKQIGKGNEWLIGPYECNIHRAAIYKDGSIPLLYVLLHLAPSDPFETDDRGDTNYSTAGFYRGQYITMQEYDDKHIVKRGKITPIKTAQLRRRNLRDDFLFLVPQTHLFFREENRKHLLDVYLKLQRSGEIDYHKLQPLQGLMMVSATQ